MLVDIGIYIEQFSLGFKPKTNLEPTNLFYVSGNKYIEHKEPP